MFTEGDTDASPRRRLFVRGSPYGTGGDSFASELRDNSADLHTLERGEVVLAKRTACETSQMCSASVREETCWGGDSGSFVAGRSRAVPTQ